MKKKFNSGTFKAEDLVFVGKAPPSDNPPLMIGDWCLLNSQSPGDQKLLVVDADHACVTLSISGGEEHIIARACVRRAAVD